MIRHCYLTLCNFLSFFLYWKNLCIADRTRKSTSALLIYLAVLLWPMQDNTIHQSYTFLPCSSEWRFTLRQRQLDSTADFYKPQMDMLPKALYVHTQKIPLYFISSSIWSRGRNRKLVLWITRKAARYRYIVNLGIDVLLLVTLTNHHDVAFCKSCHRHTHYLG